MSPYSHVPTYDPTQRLKGNPITLNLYIYNNILIYIVFGLKDLFELKISIVLKYLITWGFAKIDKNALEAKNR